MHKFHVQNRKDTKLEINGTFYIWTWTENSWSDLNLQIWPTSVQFSLSFVCFFSGHKKGHKGEKWHADESMRPASHRPLEEKEVWVWVRADFKGRSSAPLRSRTKALWQHVAWGFFFSFFWKKTFFLILFCFFAVVVFYPWLLISEFSGVLVQLRALNKFLERKKIIEGGKKVGRTLFCIFGLKSQLSGKQSSDCLVCLWNIFSFSSVTHTHISVWEHVCVCCLAQWQKLPAVRLSRTVCYASLVLGPPHFNSPVTSWLWQLWCHSRGFEQGRYQKSRRK